MCGTAKDTPQRMPVGESEDEAPRWGRRDDADEWKCGRSGELRRKAHSPASRPCLVDSEAGAVVLWVGDAVCAAAIFYRYLL